MAAHVTPTVPLGTPVCRLCGRYLTLLGRPIRVTVPAVTVAPTALVGSLIRSSNLPHSLQRGVPTDADLSIPWVESEQILHLKLGCPNFVPVQGLAIHPINTANNSKLTCLTHLLQAQTNSNQWMNDPNRVNGRTSDRAEIQTTNFKMQYVLRFYP